MGRKMSRRKWLQDTSRFIATLPPSLFMFSNARAIPIRQNPLHLQQKLSPSAAPAPSALLTGETTKYQFTSEEDALLEEVERASFRYFWEETNPYSGLVKDRSQAGGPDARATASIAATGFGLTAMCIADHRGWGDRKKIRERVANTLRFAATRLYHNNGFFFHFLNMQSGDRDFQSEVSSIDTSIFLCGALACRGYFDDAEIGDLATKLYDRVDWGWLLQGEKTLSMGWKPETGFLKARWDHYCELMMIYLLGLGSPTHPLPAETWDAWKRPLFEYDGLRFVGSN